jgi:hypothetical protein
MSERLHTSSILMRLHVEPFEEKETCDLMHYRLVHRYLFLSLHYNKRLPNPDIKIPETSSLTKGESSGDSFEPATVLPKVDPFH